MSSPVLNKEEILKRGGLIKEEYDLIPDSWKKKANLTEEPNVTNGEGIWIGLLSEDDLFLYERDDAEGSEVIGVLLNNSFQIPEPTWGLVARFKHNGRNRPSLFIEDFKDQIKDVCYDNSPIS